MWTFLKISFFRDIPLPAFQQGNHLKQYGFLLRAVYLRRRKMFQQGKRLNKNVRKMNAI
jgi:hypothetical protein